MQGDTLTNWRSVKEPLQNLLRDRFHLKTRYATKLVSGFALIATKSGPKLKSAKGGLSTAQVLPGAVWGENITCEGVATLLSRASGRAVVDQTRIKGFYDIDLRFAARTSDTDLPDLFTAVQEQLGLKLEPTKIPLEVLVIDQIDRIPTAN